MISAGKPETIQVILQDNVEGELHMQGTLVALLGEQCPWIPVDP